MNKELQKRFEAHIPLMIYPFGIGGTIGPRVIAEGFVYTDGVFFFDVGWNNPMGGYHSSHPGHFVEGKIEGPFPDLEEMMYWEIGKYATIHEILDDDYSSNFERELAVAKENQRLMERFKDDECNNRARAKTVADEFVSEFLECRRNREE